MEGASVLRPPPDRPGRTPEGGAVMSQAADPRSETGAPLDLIEGRDAQPLADWLAARPGVEIICRDRAGSYLNSRELHLTGDVCPVPRLSGQSE